MLYRECSTCEGNGTANPITNPDPRCPTCAGRGYIPVETVRDLCPCEQCRAITGRVVTPVQPPP